LRLGDVDFFSVVTRKPRIADFKPVVVEVALARFLNRGAEAESIQLLRFANRVPLQFDKSACAITNAVESVNWRSYGLQQSKDSLPLGPYVFAISVVSPFIKFKNASKETIDASDELVEEIRRALMQAGQKLSRHIRRENKEADLERKIAHIEQFGPILVDGLVRISGAKPARKTKAEEGLKKLLGRDARAAEKELSEADVKLQALKERQAKAGLLFTASSRGLVASDESEGRESDDDLQEAGEADTDVETSPRSTAKTTTAKVIETKGVGPKSGADKAATTAKAAEKSTTKATTERATTAKAATAGTTVKAVSTTAKAARK
jgi:DNA topoisomerase-6 subunit B